MTHSFPTRRSSDLPQAISLWAAKEGSAGSAAVAEGRCSNIAKDGASAWAETCTAGTVIMSIPIIPYLIIFRLVALPRIELERIDRKSVVYGKSVSVSVELGGRRLIKKKIHKPQKYVPIRQHTL